MHEGQHCSTFFESSAAASEVNACLQIFSVRQDHHFYMDAYQILIYRRQHPCVTSWWSKLKAPPMPVWRILYNGADDAAHMYTTKLKVQPFCSRIWGEDYCIDSQCMHVCKQAQIRAVSSWCLVVCCSGVIPVFCSCVIPMEGGLCTCLRESSHPFFSSLRCTVLLNLCVLQY